MSSAEGDHFRGSWVLTINGRMHLRDLVREIALRMGFATVRPDAAAVIGDALASEIGRSLESTPDGFVALLKPQKSRQIPDSNLPGVIEKESPSVALVTCSECSNSVSSKAFACPHCGNPQPAGLRAMRQAPTRQLPKGRKSAGALKFLVDLTKALNKMSKRV